jgi:hypothetical protein
LGFILDELGEASSIPFFFFNLNQFRSRVSGLIIVASILGSEKSLCFPCAFFCGRHLTVALCTIYLLYGWSQLTVQSNEFAKISTSRFLNQVLNSNPINSIL